MKIDEAGRNLIYGFEGVRLKAYKDVAGVPTIGIGFTYYPDGKKVQLGDIITPAQCDSIFAIIISTYEEAVLKAVKMPLNQNQFNALVSFSYNVGTGAFNSSTLLKRVNAKASPDLIKAAFLMWCKAGGKVNADLKQRRGEEADLFNKSISNEAIKSDK